MKKPEISKKVQKFIIADFIIKLLLSKDSTIRVIYDSVLVITDRLIKYAYFISYLETATVKNFVYIFIKNIFVNYRMPKKIILN